MVKAIKWDHSARKIEDLKPAAYNPRKLTEDQAKHLTESIERFGLCDPIVINRDNTVIGGHQRLKILKQRGSVEVPVYIPDRELSAEEEKELNIRLNKNLGEWDIEMLSAFSQEMLKGVGFSSQELDRIFRIEEDENEDSVPDVKDNPYSVRRGDIWQLGRHRIMCGDSTSEADAEVLMQGNRAEMCFTDPPYNVDYQGGMNAFGQNKRSGIANDKMSKTDFYEFLVSVCKNIVKNTIGGIYICMSSSEMQQLRSAFSAGGGGTGRMI